MRRFLACVVVVASVIVGCEKPVDYRSVEGRFRVRFPAPARERVHQVDSPVGPLTMHVVEAGIAANFAVAYADYPNALDINLRLDGVRDGIARGMGSKVLTETVKDLQPCFGRELVLEGPKSQSRARILVCGLRLYQVMWHGRASFTYSQKVNDFLDSFRLDPQP